jgi:hypothetical protein
MTVHPIYSRMRVDIYIGKDSDKDLNPLDWSDPAVAQALKDFLAAVAAETGGYTESHGWGASPECPDGERSLIVTTYTSKPDALYPLVEAVRDGLKQACVLVAETPALIRFI